MSNIAHHNLYNSFSLELRQGAGEEQEQQSNGAGEGEGHQGWKEKVLYKFTYLLIVQWDLPSAIEMYTITYYIVKPPQKRLIQYQSWVDLIRKQLIPYTAPPFHLN